MDTNLLVRLSEYRWEVEPSGKMIVPAIIYGTEDLIRDMDHKVYEQICNVASLPGIQKAAYAMPDAHWGYGFPIGGVAAFDPDEGGVVSAGGVGFDISCGVRALHTGLTVSEVEPSKGRLADALAETVPAGLGRGGRIRLGESEMDAMLAGGARWAVRSGYGQREDLERIESRGCAPDARPGNVSARARQRQHDEMGTLGSGNHYLEVQRVVEVFDTEIATTYSLHPNDVLVSVHCGSRGLGHQIGTEFLKEMTFAAAQYEIALPDRELACAPINSPVGKEYLGAMRAAMNCALANRQIITHLAREAFARVLPGARLELLYDVSHNTCQVEEHAVDGDRKTVFVHRKGATRAFPPGHPDLPADLRSAGQPVLIGGSMGTSSYVLAGTAEGWDLSFASACHGAGRRMSRHAALKLWGGRQVVDELAQRGILIRSRSFRGVAEEAPGAYKDVAVVVEAAHQAGLAKKVARLEPLVCVKG